MTTHTIWVQPGMERDVAALLNTIEGIAGAEYTGISRKVVKGEEDNVRFHSENHDHRSVVDFIVEKFGWYTLNKAMI